MQDSVAQKEQLGVARMYTGSEAADRKAIGDIGVAGKDEDVELGSTSDEFDFLAHTDTRDLAEKLRTMIRSCPRVSLVGQRFRAMLPTGVFSTRMLPKTSCEEHVCQWHKNP